MLWPEQHQGLSTRQYYNLVFTTDKFHVFCALILVCLAILHMAPPPSPLPSLMSSDFNESDRCNAIWWKPVLSFSSLQPALEENRSATGFLPKINFRNYKFEFCLDKIFCLFEPLFPASCLFAVLIWYWCRGYQFGRLDALKWDIYSVKILKAPHFGKGRPHICLKVVRIK